MKQRGDARREERRIAMRHEKGQEKLKVGNKNAGL